jgi:hypothetical protein
MMTPDQLRARLRRARADLGPGGGRFSLTFYEEPQGGACSLMYWSRPENGGTAVEACHEVAHGTLDACLAALDRYVAERRRPPA